MAQLLQPVRDRGENCEGARPGQGVRLRAAGQPLGHGPVRRPDPEVIHPGAEARSDAERQLLDEEVNVARRDAGQDRRRAGQKEQAGALSDPDLAVGERGEAAVHRSIQPHQGRHPEHSAAIRLERAPQCQDLRETAEARHNQEPRQVPEEADQQAEPLQLLPRHFAKIRLHCVQAD